MEDKTRRLNRAQNDLAEFQGKNVLNPNSSSCGSAASSEIASRAGGGVVGSKSIEEGGNEMSGGKDGGFISGGPASEVSEELSHEADKGGCIEGIDFNPYSSFTDVIVGGS